MKRTPVLLVLALVVATIGFAPTAHAAPAAVPGPLVWVGGHGPNWSTAANWSPARPPVNGDELSFDPSPTPQSTNDLADLTLSSITTRGDGVVLSGNGVAIVQGIFATAGGATIAFDLRLAGAEVALFGNLVVTSAISGPGSLHLDAAAPLPGQNAATVTFTGSTANSYTGDTSIGGGAVLRLAKDPGVPCIPNGTVTVDANANPNQARSNLVVASSDQIGDRVAVTIPDSRPDPGGLRFDPSSAQDLKGYSERVGPLSVGASGSITMIPLDVLAAQRLTMTSQSSLDLNTFGDLGPQIRVDGPVVIGGATLALSNFGVVPTVGQPLTLVDAGGSDPVSGTFAGLPEGGAGFTRGPHSLDDPNRQLLYRISYRGGDGNDITETPIDPIEFLLRFSYQRLLGRAPDPGGLTYWDAFLRNGGDTTPFTRALTGSVEGRGFVVQSTYQEILGRPTDPEGLAYWRAAIVGGLQVNVFKAALFASAEYQGRLGAGSNQGFVTSLYDSPLVFDRTPDPAGLAYWTDQLDRGLRSRTDVVLAMLRTDDSAVANLNDLTLPLSVRGRMSVDIDRFLGGDYYATLAEALSGPIND